MANADAVTSIADLWVAAAINADEGDSNDVFESSDDEEEEGQEGPQGQEQEPRMLVGTDIENALDDGSPAPARLQPRHPSTSLYAGHTPQRHFSNTTSTFSPDRTPASRRGSSVTPSVPAIFSHVGVSTPTAVLDAQQLLMRSSEDAVDDGLLGTISEGILLSPESPSSHLTATQHQEEMEAGQMDEKQPSLTSQLPWLVVLQYGMLALHSTTHDQVFLSYVVSEYNVGGLGLNAGHFAQLSMFLPSSPCPLTQHRANFHFNSRANVPIPNLLPILPLPKHRTSPRSVLPPSDVPPRVLPLHSRVSHRSALSRIR